MGDTVCVHVGQCGVQIGAELWASLRREGGNHLFDASHPNNYARAVLVDRYNQIKSNRSISYMLYVVLAASPSQCKPPSTNRTYSIRSPYS